MSTVGSVKKEVIRLWLLFCATVVFAVGAYGVLAPWLVSADSDFLVFLGVLLSIIVAPLCLGLLAFELVAQCFTIATYTGYKK